jgi:hypothetical protein
MAAECLHVAGEAADGSTVDLTVLDLAHPRRGDAHLGSNLLLCKVPGLADLGKPICTDLVAQLIFSGANLLLAADEQFGLYLVPFADGHREFLHFFSLSVPVSAGARHIAVRRPLPPSGLPR